MSKIEIAKMSDLDTVNTNITDIDRKVDSLHKVATTGSYNDLDNKPVTPIVPTKLSELQNDTGFITTQTASQIPISVEGLSGENVGDIIVELKALIDALNV